MNQLTRFTVQWQQAVMVGEAERTFHEGDKIYEAAVAVKLSTDRGLEFPRKRKRTLIVGDTAF